MVMLKLVLNSKDKSIQIYNPEVGQPPKISVPHPYDFNGLQVVIGKDNDDNLSAVLIEGVDFEGFVFEIVDKLNNTFSAEIVGMVNG